MDTLTLAQATTRWGGSTVQGAMNNCKESIHLRVTCGKSTQSLNTSTSASTCTDTDTGTGTGTGNSMVGWDAEMSGRIE